jgi:hypothetical protein
LKSKQDSPDTSTIAATATLLKTIDQVCEDITARHRDRYSLLARGTFRSDVSACGTLTISENDKQIFFRTIWKIKFQSRICRAIDANEFHCALQELICITVVEAQLG